MSRKRNSSGSAGGAAVADKSVARDAIVVEDQVLPEPKPAAPEAVVVEALPFVPVADEAPVAASVALQPTVRDWRSTAIKIDLVAIVLVVLAIVVILAGMYLHVFP